LKIGVFSKVIFLPRKFANIHTAVSVLSSTVHIPILRSVERLLKGGKATLSNDELMKVIENCKSREGRAVFLALIKLAVDAEVWENALSTFNVCSLVWLSGGLFYNCPFWTNTQIVRFAFVFLFIYCCSERTHF
jgi:hypothetical protein